MQSEIAFGREPELARKRGEGARHTILVVEDEDFVRNVTCEVLQFAGYEVLAARDAAEAAALFAESSRVTLLLTDVVLPGRTGGELARELRAMHPELKVILISGYPQGRVKTVSLQESGVLYLEKPFSAEGLIRKVWRALHEDWAVPRESGRRKAVRGS
jgi:two-component system, cell cycle sensor histidine kinase and response regulator CckA